MKALLRVVWSLIFLVFGVRMVNAEEQEIQAQKTRREDLYPTRRVDLRWKRMLHWETREWKWDEIFCKEEIEHRSSQGKGPRTFEEDTQGGDLGYSSSKQPQELF